MKREIKFRAWDGENIIHLEDADILKRYETVMQYTGLKDKNEVEIYEGDVIQYKKDYSVRGLDKEKAPTETHILKSTVFFSKGSFLIDYNIPCSSLPEKHISGENHACSWEEKYYDFEVIGNIHEI